MKIRTIVSTLAALGTVLLVGASAHAQVLVNENANPVLGTGATGTYNVVLQLSNPLTNTYEVIVKGNNNGNPPGTLPPPQPKHTVDQLAFTFLNTGVTVLSTSGGTTAGTDASGTTTGAGYFSVPLNGNESFNVMSVPGTPVLAYGGNEFDGFITFSGALKGGDFNVAIQNNSQQWNFQSQITPEASSILLLLAAVLPLGLLALRRRHAASRIA